MNYLSKAAIFSLVVLSSFSTTMSHPPKRPTERRAMDSQISRWTVQQRQNIRPVTRQENIPLLGASTSSHLKLKHSWQLASKFIVELKNLEDDFLKDKLQFENQVIEQEDEKKDEKQDEEQDEKEKQLIASLKNFFSEATEEMKRDVIDRVKDEIKNKIKVPVDFDWIEREINAWDPDIKKNPEEKMHKKYIKKYIKNIEHYLKIKTNKKDIKKFFQSILSEREIHGNLEGTEETINESIKNIKETELGIFLGENFIKSILKGQELNEQFNALIIESSFYSKSIEELENWLKTVPYKNRLYRITDQRNKILFQEYKNMLKNIFDSILFENLRLTWYHIENLKK